MEAATFEHNAEYAADRYYSVAAYQLDTLNAATRAEHGPGPWENTDETSGAVSRAATNQSYNLMPSYTHQIMSAAQTNHTTPYPHLTYPW